MKLEFISDNMLRGLARWLRILGFTTHIVVGLEEALRIKSEHPDAVYLSASRKNLAVFNHLDGYLVSEPDIASQLKELNSRFQIFEKIQLLKLCTVCNSPVQEADAESVKDRIPERIQNSFAKFWICPVCGRIYWKGGHVQRLLNKLARMGVPIAE